MADDNTEGPVAGGDGAARPLADDSGEGPVAGGAARKFWRRVHLSDGQSEPTCSAILWRLLGSPGLLVPSCLMVEKPSAGR